MVGAREVRRAWERFFQLSGRGKAVVLAIGLLLFGGLLSIGALGGWFLSQERLIERVQARLAERAYARDLADGAIEVSWREIATNMHLIEYLSLPLGPLAGAGGLAEVGPNLVVASASGRLDYLTSEFRAGDVGLVAPMNWEGLSESGILDDPLFFRGGFRTLDLLAGARADGTFDLYVSHLRFRADARCFEIVVSATGVRSDTRGVIPLGEPWRDVFVGRQCVPARGETLRFGGVQSGGRMLFLTPSTLLLTVGDFEYDGVNSDRTVSMDMQSDLGKLLEVNIQTGEAKIFASGLRNPQGLVVTRDGRIWETEHGPQGGDELNLMQRGGNYGWPLATYGANYRQPPDNQWPLAARAGMHGGDYVRPRFAFVPSIGISNLVEPDTGEFPRWSEHLLVSSLRSRSLFLLKMEGDQVAYVERIPFHRRMRDMIVLRDGRIAVQSDAGYLVLFRNGDEAPGVDERVLLTGLDDLSDRLPQEPDTFDANPAQRGENIFLRACVQCHSTTDVMHVGPPIASIIGRDIGSIDGYAYSQALQEAEGEWTRDRLEALLSDPAAAFPGTSMPAVPLTRQDFDDLYAYLEELTEAQRQGD